MNPKNSSRKDWIQMGLTVVAAVQLAAIAGLYFRVQAVEGEMALISQQWEQQQREINPVGLPKGSPAPSFQVETAEGQNLELKHFSGAKVLMVFTALDCQACDRVYAMLRRIQQSRPDWEVVLVVKGAIDEVIALVERESLPFTVALWSEKLARDYRVSAIPSWTTINESGNVIDARYLTTQPVLDRFLAPSGKNTP